MSPTARCSSTRQTASRSAGSTCPSGRSISSTAGETHAPSRSFFADDTQCVALHHDEMVKQLMADLKGAYFEIEGHTDNVGDKARNEKLGLERAEAVERYLSEHRQIPLHKMNVISYGEDKPLAPNTTKEGRAQNRAVVIRVLI
jgi:outer membrane protein OmpA-like peptidoglycan-associated protein